MRLALLIAAWASASGGLVLAEPGDPPAVEAYIGVSRKVEVAPGRSLNLVCMGGGRRTVLFDAGGSDWAVIWALVQPQLARHARACA